MKVVRGIDEVRAWRAALPGGAIGFVPTMGALHAGHRSLMARARADCEHVAASVFVNPTQFAPGEDLSTYPRTEDSDTDDARAEAVDLLWFGATDELYPDGFQTRIEVPDLAAGLCGATRPGHFAGVAVVVLKLLNIVRPDRAYFGRKDYQQLCVVTRMVRDLDLPVEIVPCPVTRAEDGLALSSRHQRLSERGRATATAIPRALSAVRAAFAAGERDATALVLCAVRVLSGTQGLDLEYVELVHPETLAVVSTGESTSVLALAASLEGVRLIDNTTLAGEDTLP